MWSQSALTMGDIQARSLMWHRLYVELGHEWYRDGRINITPKGYTIYLRGIRFEAAPSPGQTMEEFFVEVYATLVLMGAGDE